MQSDNGKPYTVAGVLPSWFTYPDAGIQLWVPYKADASAEMLQHHDWHGSQVVARLRPDVSLASAIAQVSAVQYQLHLQYPHDPVAEDVAPRSLNEDLADLSSKKKGLPFRQPLLARALSYCTVKVTITGTVIAPETALIVTCVVEGPEAVVLAAACGVVDAEQPMIAVAAISSRAKSDPPARIDLRLRPANASSPTGPINARVRLVRDRNKWTG